MIKETIIIDGRTLYKTYHDTYMIRKVGTNEVYDEAIDPAEAEREYEITDILKNEEEKE